MTTPDLTLSELRSLLHYDPETGVFTWLPRARERFSSDRIWRMWNTRYAGRVAGGAHNKGYLHLFLCGHHHLIHRLAWLYVHGRWPVEQIDHINGARDDNRLCNLREASQNINLQNQSRAHRNSSTGIMGVSWHKASGKYIAQLTLGKKKLYLGVFDDPFEAEKVYLSAKRELHPGCLL